MPRLTLYTTEPCGYCARAKGLLKSRGLEFEEVNLARDSEGRAELARRTGMMTFPQILVDDELVGGYHDLERAVSDGRLEGLLAA